MADIPITQAMDNMGVGDMSMQDFINGLSASIMGKVGAAEKYGKEKSEEQKKAEEQLKKMEKLTEGLEELNETIKKIQQALDKTKSKVSSGGNFGNLTAALSKIAGGGGELSKLEQTTFQKLSKMADESLSSHCLGVKDVVLWGKVDKVVQEIQRLTSIMSSIPTRKMGGRRRGGGGGGATGGGGAEVGGLGEASRPGEAGSPTEALEKQNQELSLGSSLFGQMERKSGEWARKLKVSKGVIDELLNRTVTIYGYDAGRLAKLEKTLDLYHKLDKATRSQIDAQLARADYVLKTEGSLEHQKDLMDGIVGSTQRAGTVLQSGFLRGLADTRARLGAINQIIQSLNPAQVMGGNTNFGIAQNLRESSELISRVGQLTYATGGFVGDITRAAGTWQNAVLQGFMQSATIANELGINKRILERATDRTITRGLTRDFRTAQDFARTGLQLGLEIGANAEHTAEEINTWVMRFRMSNAEARLMASSVQNIGRLTGITGDHLLEAVKAAQQFAEEMRLAGNYTQESAAALIQISAVAQRLGVQQPVGAIQRGLTTRSNFLEMNDQLRAFTLRAGSMGGVGAGDIQFGNVLRSPELRRQFAQGLSALTEDFERMIREGGGGIEIQQIVSDMISRQTGGAIRGIEGLRLTRDAFLEGTENVEQAITRLQASLNANTNATDAERRAMQERIDNLRTFGNAGGPEAVLSRLNQSLSGAEGQGRSLEQGLAAGGQNRAQVEAAIRAMATRNNMQNIDALVARAMSSGAGFRNVLDTLTAADQTRRAAERKATDPATIFQSAMEAWSNKWKTFIDTSWADLLSRIPTGALANLALLAVISNGILGVLGFIGPLISSLGTLLGGAGGWTGMLSGAGGAASAAMPWLAAAIMPIIGAIHGYMGAEAAGRGGVEGTTLGILTGGAERGGLLASLFGMDTTTRGGQVAGVGTGGLWGAGAGALIGTAIAPGIGTAIGAAIGGVLGIGGEVYKLLTDKTSAFFSQGFTDALEQAGKSLSDIWDGFVAVFSGLWEGIKEVWEGIVGVLNEFWQEVGPDVIYFVDQISTALLELFNWLAPYVKKIGEFIGWLFKDVIGKGLKIIFIEILGPIFKLLGKGIGFIFRGLGAVVEIFRRIGTLIDPFVAGLKRIWGWIEDIGTAINDYFIQPIITFFTETIPNAFWAVVGFFNDWFVQPIVGFFTETIPNAWRNVVTFFTETLPNAFRDNFITPVTRFFTETVPNFFADIATRLWNALPAWLRNILDPHSTTSATQQQVNEAAAAGVRDSAGNPVVPGGNYNIETRYPGGILNARNWGWGIGDFINSFDVGTRDIQRTGLGMLHQGEMIVPETIARHLRAEGTGPFQDAIALVRPGDNAEMMRRRIQTEFAGTAETSPATTRLDDLNEENRRHTDLLRQQIQALNAILAAMTRPQGAARADTAPNSRPSPPPQYYDWAVRPLNQPNYGGVENLPRG